jgi:hypothetical protein
MLIVSFMLVIVAHLMVITNSGIVTSCYRIVIIVNFWMDFQLVDTVIIDLFKEDFQLYWMVISCWMVIVRIGMFGDCANNYVACQ